MRNIAAIVSTAIAAAFAAAACGDPTGGSRPLPLAPTITASVLVAGGEGRLEGNHLDKLTGSIIVDGTAVAPTAASASEIRFKMPASRPCDVDGRPISVQAGTVGHTGQLHIPRVLRMEVGESRILSRDELPSLCMQMPAGSERYVLTVLNTELAASPSPDALLTVRSWTGAGAGAGASLRVSGTDNGSRELAPRRSLAAGEHAYADQPVPFDGRYSTAQVGDTLPWVDWWGASYPNCAGPREQVPTISIVVAAVSISGKTVIAFDARSSRSDEWTAAPARAGLARMAEMMDRWAVPAVREAMDRNYVPLKGAGGRWFHVFRTDALGWTVDNNDAPQTACRYASEVPSTVGPDLPPANDAQAAYFAGLAIHEYGHHAEMVYRIRRWGNTSPPGRVATTWGSLGEAWAQTVQETAARLASGQPTGARYGPLEAAGSEIPFADFYLNGYGGSPGQSPWSVTAGANRGGYYDQGTRLLMFLRERWGDAALGSTRERFFPRVQELSHYDLPSIAGLVGMTADSALDLWSLAEATDDLVDPAAAAGTGLPQIATWVPHDAGPLPSVMVPRTGDRSWTLSAGRGNYAALYLFAEGSDAGKGVSLTFGNVGAGPLIARITRLR